MRCAASDCGRDPGRPSRRPAGRTGSQFAWMLRCSMRERTLVFPPPPGRVNACGVPGLATQRAGRTRRDSAIAGAICGDAARRRLGPMSPMQSPMQSPDAERRARASLALAGLSVGDAFGERFFAEPETVEHRIEGRGMPPGPWRGTDDTAMAIAVVEILESHGAIDPDLLAAAFARRYGRDPARGYGGGAHRILQALVLGMPWAAASRLVFD